MKYFVLGVLGLVLAGVSYAAQPKLQASMAVTGELVVGPDGKAMDYTLDQPEKLPPAVVELIARTVPGWRFATVSKDGKPVAAKARMSLGVIADPTDNGAFALRVGAATFGSDNDEDLPHPLKGDHATYPQEAITRRVSGTAYLLLKLGADGKVAKAAVERVDLRAIGSERDMALMRAVFAKAALHDARHWAYALPHAPGRATAPMLARVPVDYFINGEGIPREPRYGQWRSYVPGPVQPIDWPELQPGAQTGFEALAGEGIYPLEQPLKLLDPAGGRR
jgi:hypothetical protein